LNTCYYHQDLHYRQLQQGSHPAFRATRTPSYSFRLTLGETVRYKPHDSPLSIFGATPFGW